MISLTIKSQPNGCYYVARDGIVYGDSRGFPSEVLADQEIRKIMAKDAREAVVYARPLLYSAESRA